MHFVFLLRLPRQVTRIDSVPHHLHDHQPVPLTFLDSTSSVPDRLQFALRLTGAAPPWQNCDIHLPLPLCPDCVDPFAIPAPTRGLRLQGGSGFK